MIKFHLATSAAGVGNKMHHKRSYKNADPVKFPIIIPFSDHFFPFTIQKDITGETISEILLINYITNEETDLTSDSGLTDLKSIEEYDDSFEELRYDGDTLDTTLTDGMFYLKITLTSTEIYYSNIFKIET